MPQPRPAGLASVPATEMTVAAARQSPVLHEPAVERVRALAQAAFRQPARQQPAPAPGPRRQRAGPVQARRL